MKFEEEVIVGDILPAIRSVMADGLQRNYGLTQEDIASKLEVTQPAVSQYMNDERADQEVVEKIRDDPQVSLIIDEAVSKAARNDDYSGDIGHAIQTIRDKGLFKEKFQDTRKL
ncbi:MAG: transcriptional regulator [Candidatus Nanohaloarchaea archaeon]